MATGNLKQRPGGFTNQQRRLFKRFYLDAFKIWKKQGEQSLHEMAINEPGRYCQMMAGLMPKTLDLNHEVNHQHTIDLGSVLTELAQITESIGINNLNQLPHTRTIEHSQPVDSKAESDE